MNFKYITECLVDTTPNVVYFYQDNPITRKVTFKCNVTSYEVSFDYYLLHSEFERINSGLIQLKDWVISRIIKPLATGIIAEDISFEDVTFELSQSNQAYDTDRRKDN